MCQSAQELIESASLTWNVTGQNPLALHTCGPIRCGLQRLSLLPCFFGPYKQPEQPNFITTQKKVSDCGIVRTAGLFCLKLLIKKISESKS